MAGISQGGHLVSSPAPPATLSPSVAAWGHSASPERRKTAIKHLVYVATAATSSRPDTDSDNRRRR